MICDGALNDSVKKRPRQLSSNSPSPLAGNLCHLGVKFNFTNPEDRFRIEAIDFRGLAVKTAWI